MDNFQINYEAGNVKEIMDQIKNKINEKRIQGVYDNLVEQLLDDKYYTGVKSNVYTDLTTLNELAKLDLTYPFRTHRLFWGTIIIGIKKTVRFLYRLALRPVYQQQESYNTLVVKVLHDLVSRVDKLEREKETYAQPNSTDR